MLKLDKLLNFYTETGLEAIERLRFLASFPLPGTGQREGGEKTQPFNRFASHPVNVIDPLSPPNLKHVPKVVQHTWPFPSEVPLLESLIPSQTSAWDMHVLSFFRSPFLRD